jgi:hypothetical protein
MSGIFAYSSCVAQNRDSAPDFRFLRNSNAFFCGCRRVVDKNAHFYSLLLDMCAAAHVFCIQSWQVRCAHCCFVILSKGVRGP